MGFGVEGPDLPKYFNSGVILKPYTWSSCFQDSGALRCASPEGPHLKIMIHGRAMHPKIVAKHVYLGAVITYKRFEAETFRHRLQIAKGSFTRLGPILRNRSVPMSLRLQLWKGCVWPALLHGLDCTGLPSAEHHKLQVQLIKQARSIANSYSMFRILARFKVWATGFRDNQV